MTSRHCRLCGGDLREVLDLGRQPVSNAFAPPGSDKAVTFFELKVGLCTSCSMVQQIDTMPPTAMYRADYPYRASGSSMIRRHFEEVARNIIQICPRGIDGFVVEIGSNDGVMLTTLSAAGMRHLGIDPAAAADDVARSHHVRIRNDFFNETTAAEILTEHGAADLIFSANTVSHIADLPSVFRGVNILLADDGLFVIEDRSLADILRNNYFDQIYDEHIYLFSVTSVRNTAAQYGFELINIEHLPIHGGSIHYTIARQGMLTPTAAVAEFLTAERSAGLTTAETFTRFAGQIDRVRTDLVTLLTKFRTDGKRVVGYGATSRSATVLNYCGIGPELLPMVCDSTREKQGCVTPGSDIPVVTPEAFSCPYPDYALLFAWNHADEIMGKEQQFSKQGGRWVLYAPDVHIV